LDFFNVRVTNGVKRALSVPSSLTDRQILHFSNVLNMMEDSCMEFQQRHLLCETNIIAAIEQT